MNLCLNKLIISPGTRISLRVKALRSAWSARETRFLDATRERKGNLLIPKDTHAESFREGNFRRSQRNTRGLKERLDYDTRKKMDFSSPFSSLLTLLACLLPNTQYTILYNSPRHDDERGKISSPSSRLAYCFFSFSSFTRIQDN